MRPGVLRVDAEVAEQRVLVAQRRVVDRDRARHAVGVDLLQVGVGLARVDVGAPVVLEAELGVVRAGDVRHRRLRVEAIGIAAAPVGQPAAQASPASESRRLAPAYHSARAALLVDAVLVGDDVLLVVERVAGVEQQLAADRRWSTSARRRCSAARSRSATPSADRRRRSCRGRGTCRSPRSRPRTCCAGSTLPRQAQRRAVDVLVVDALLAGDAPGLAVGVGRARRHVERVGNRRVHAAQAAGERRTTACRA